MPATASSLLYSRCLLQIPKILPYDTSSTNTFIDSWTSGHLWTQVYKKGGAVQVRRSGDRNRCGRRRDWGDGGTWKCGGDQRLRRRRCWSRGWPQPRDWTSRTKRRGRCCWRRTRARSLLSRGQRLRSSVWRQKRSDGDGGNRRSSSWTAAHA